MEFDSKFWHLTLVNMFRLTSLLQNHLYPSPTTVHFYLNCLLHPSNPEGPVADGGNDYVLLLRVNLCLDVLADAALAAFTRDGFFRYGTRSRNR